MKFKTARQQFYNEIVASHLDPLRLLTDDNLAAIDQAITQACDRIIDALEDPDTWPAGAATAPGEVIATLHPTGQPPNVWWRTPLGRLVAGRGVPADRGISHADAATILDVHAGTIATLASRGTIPKAADGTGLSLTAVLARLIRLSNRPAIGAGAR